MTYIQTDEDYNEYLQLASTFEVMHLNSSNPVSGWFKAPANGQYRFYVSCGSACTLEMNTESPFDIDNISIEMPELTTIASLSEGSNWRGYDYPDDDGHYSEWFTLVEGEHYYMSGTTSSD